MMFNIAQSPQAQYIFKYYMTENESGLVPIVCRNTLGTPDDRLNKEKRIKDQKTSR